MRRFSLRNKSFLTVMYYKVFYMSSGFLNTLNSLLREILHYCSDRILLGW